MSSIDLEFASKVLLIVAGSWGILFVLRIIQHCISPSYTENVLRNAQPFDTTRFDKSPTKNEEGNMAFGFETENDDDEDYVADIDEKENDKKPLL